MISAWTRRASAWALVLAALAGPFSAYAGEPVCGQGPLMARPVGVGLYELAYSPARQSLYVAVSGGFDEQAPPARVAHLDPATLQEQSSLLLPYKVFGLALDEGQGRLYAGHSLEGRISVIDVQRWGRLADIEVSPKPPGAQRAEHDLRALVLDTAARRLYVPGLSAEGSVLFVIGLDSLRVEARLDGLGFYPTGLALDAEGGRLFVSNMGGEIIQIDTQALRITQRWRIGGLEQPVGLAYDAARNRLYVADQGMASIRDWQARVLPGFVSRHDGNRILALDASDGRVLAEVPTQANPLALHVESSQGRVYVTERGAGSVAVFDVDTLERLQDWHTGDLPNSLAVDGEHGRLWVSLKQPREAGRLAMEQVACLMVRHPDR